MRLSRRAALVVVTLTTAATTAVLSACSVLQPPQQGLNAREAEIKAKVTASAPVPYQPKDLPNQEITKNLGQWVKDEGLGVSWQYQGIYPDSNRGTVVTFLVRNDNPVPLPTDAIKPPKLERTDGTGGYIPVVALPWDPEVNRDILAPGLFEPLGVGAATNLQYRMDTTTGTLWKARLEIGNVTWTGNLNNWDRPKNQSGTQ